MLTEDEFREQVAVSPHGSQGEPETGGITAPPETKGAALEPPPGFGDDAINKALREGLCQNCVELEREHSLEKENGRVMLARLMKLEAELSTCKAAALKQRGGA